MFKKKAITKIKLPSQLQYASRLTARVIQVRPILIGVHKHYVHNAQLNQIRDFIGFLKWDITKGSTPGLIWLEAFALFEIFSNTVEHRQNGPYHNTQITSNEKQSIQYMDYAGTTQQCAHEIQNQTSHNIRIITDYLQRIVNNKNIVTVAAFSWSSFPILFLWV